MHSRETVVIVVSNLEYGGAQRQIVELTNNIDREIIDLHVCSLSEYVPLAALLRTDSGHLHIVRKKSKFDITVVPRLAQLLRKLNASAVHGYLFDAEIAARLAGRLAGTRAVGNSERNTDYVLKRRQRIAYRLTRPCVDFYVANSRAGAKFNQATLGNPRECYFTIHNGVDTERFRPQSAAAIRESLGLAPDHFVIGMFGSFKKQKNHPLLFRALSRLLERYPNTRLLLVGDQLAGGLHGSDDYKRETVALARKLNLERVCVYAGNRDNVENLYPACDVTALPSLFEGTPNVALESMACSVPVVATDVSDNRYIIRDGETGFVVPLDDPDRLAARLAQLAANPEARGRMGRQGRQWMEAEFSCARLAQKTTAVYLDVTGTTPGAAADLRSFR